VLLRLRLFSAQAPWPIHGSMAILLAQKLDLAFYFLLDKLFHCRHHSLDEGGAHLRKEHSERRLALVHSR